MDKFIDELSLCLHDPRTNPTPPPPPQVQQTREEIAAERERKAQLLDEKWQATLNRFEAAQTKVQLKISKQKELLDAQEDKELCFQPKIDQRSRRIAHEFPSFMERQASAIAWRNKHIEDERIQKLLELNIISKTQEELTLTSKPNAVPPCLCGGTTPNHTNLCRQFQATYSSTSFPIHKKTARMKRSVDDMFAYAQAKHLRQVERMLALQEQEAMEATFTPKLNPRSKKIYMAMVQAGKRRSHREDNNNQAMTPSFQPQINAKSRALLANNPSSSKNVFDRLEDHAEERQLKLAQNNIELVDSSTRNVKHIGKNDLQLQRILMSPKAKGGASPLTKIILDDSVDVSSILSNFTSDIAQPQVLKQEGTIKGPMYDGYEGNKHRFIR
ncbi:hypothetical protein THRCLA_02332 [Thraustotheca clavata]|uniref:Uncharacterized protein n=1 Tax=Thraustotheca clavata TaxID=74557 RepID=A0A1W0A5L3_9STRA|nr:hypothetical protein THRCLA_02332 [Thraustotheca clavata]